MNIAFTICSNNYLAQAKTLGDSFLNYNKDIQFFIFLCDEKLPNFDYEDFNEFKLVTYKELNIESIHSLLEKYNIVELNTAIKATCFKYIQEHIVQVEKIIYLDPDIEVYNSLHILFDELDLNDIVLTPHLLKPLHLDSLSPSESLFLNHGIYNLGFIGLNIKKTNSLSFLNWWEERLFKYCYNDLCNGLFVDQLWINHVPIFFENVNYLSF
jgi:lipopolysaccharide biosynthesis glycosyltransferase